MNIQSGLERSVRAVLRPFGLQLQRIREQGGEPTMAGAFLRARRRGIDVATVIDVGASDGRWSLAAMRYLPNAQYILIEAQPVHQLALQQCTSRRKNMQYVLAAAGDRGGYIYFDASDPFGGAVSYTPPEKNGIEVPVTTIDTLVDQYKLIPPYCIKLDTHGFEVPILQGAATTLSKSNLIIMEIYNFKYRDGQLRFHEMCGFMDRLGFWCADLADPMYRPNDGALWQADMFFVPKTDGVFLHDTYVW